MPKEYVQTLKVLQVSIFNKFGLRFILKDKAPALPFDEIKVAVEYDLSKRIDEVFDRFNEKAIAAASLAQVHEGWLKTGERVAVKV